MKRISHIVLYLLVFILGGNSPVNASGNGFFNVNDYNITGTDSELITDQLNKLIQEVYKKGGGTIYFPSGTYHTAAIKLLSNITIYIDAGATLKFSDNFEDYLPMVESRYEGVELFSFAPFIYAYKAENINITGRGTLDGQGKKWWYKHWEHFDTPIDENEVWQKEFREKNKGMLIPDDAWIFERGFCRPPFIQPMYCTNVRIEGVTIVNSPFWTVNPEFCENVTITGVTINNPPSPNTDGINPESCKNVHISDCHISVGDDCITIKSGKDLPGRTKGVPAENYTITNCTMLSGHGGVVIGSEMSGGVKNIVISNCIFDGTDRGIRIKSTRGRGGIVENIRVSNVIMHNISKEAVKLNLCYSDTDEEPVSERTPVFRDIHFSNLTGNAKHAVVIIGLPEMPVNNISFTDINLVSDSGVFVTDAKDIRFTNFTITNTIGTSFKISNSSIVELNGCNRKSNIQDLPIIELNDVKNALVHNCFQTVDAGIFISVKGTETEDIYIRDNTVLKTSKEVSISDGVKTGEVIIE